VNGTIVALKVVWKQTLSSLKPEPSDSKTPNVAELVFLFFGEFFLFFGEFVIIFSGELVFL
jgi:hypothetical protein